MTKMVDYKTALLFGCMYNCVLYTTNNSYSQVCCFLFETTVVEDKNTSRLFENYRQVAFLQIHKDHTITTVKNQASNSCSSA